MHKNTKYWCFTWGTTVTQKKLPNEIKLKKFLNNITEICVFQLERGTIKNKEHYQGAFTLVGPRISKKQLLERFQEVFNNVSGLTLSKTYDSKAAMKYASKIDSRVKGPFYVGQKENYSEEYSSMNLRQWQKELFEFIVINKNNPIIRERKIIWVEDSKGCTGKSKFQKWLRLGQREIIARKLPVSSVERLISAVTKLTREQEVDLLMINFINPKVIGSSALPLLSSAFPAELSISIFVNSSPIFFLVSISIFFQKYFSIFLAITKGTPTKIKYLKSNFGTLFKTIIVILKFK
nr:hypothetical protein [Cylindrotheca closterium]